MARSSDSAPVGVIIVHYNADCYLRRCLESLRNQTLRPRKIVVVDNASTQGPPYWLHAAFPEVTPLFLDKNVGFAAANNLAIRDRVETEWMALLNPDAYPEPTWLAELMVAAERYPKYSCFGSHMIDAKDRSRLDGTGDIYHVSGLTWRRDHRRPVSLGRRGADEIFSPCAAAALYRRETVLAVGGFDEHYFCYLEDVDLAFRLRLAGHRCRYVPDAVVYHVGSASTGFRSDFSVYYGHRNLVWTYVKNMPFVLFWLFLPLHVLLTVASVVLLTLRGQGKVVWRAKRDALFGLRRVWRQRRQIQAQAKAGAGDIWRVLYKGLPVRRRRV